MTNVSVVFSTIDSSQQAQKISHSLVEEKIAACVNILPAVTSVYRWQNQIQNDSELLLIIKTETDKLQKLIDRLEELHPYKVPEILSFRIEAGSNPYLNWVRDQVSE
jgi:periplasmic divalent cation tolerance protein